jgi:hypothetical protein
MQYNKLPFFLQKEKVKEIIKNFGASNSNGTRRRRSRLSSAATQILIHTTEYRHEIGGGTDDAAGADVQCL